MLTSLRKLFYVIITFFLIIACQKSEISEGAPAQTINNTESPVMSNFKLPYDLKDPDKKYKLPGRLTEVSGIQFMGDNTFACIQDEAGKIYIYNADKDEITKDYHFAKDGDYEDLEIIGSTVFVIRSDGRLYKIDGFPAEKMEVRHRDLPFRQANDLEGLCYDSATNQLLLACKAEAGLKGKIKNKKAVYSFDLETKTLNTTPRFLIDRDDLKDFADEKKLDFQPSGIAKHPISGNFYLIASAGKLLVVLNEQGDILEVKKLDEDKLKQPEGITFDPDGNLYISNEGRSGKGNILFFKYKKND